MVADGTDGISRKRSGCLQLPDDRPLRCKPLRQGKERLLGLEFGLVALVEHLVVRRRDEAGVRVALAGGGIENGGSLCELAAVAVGGSQTK